MVIVTKNLNTFWYQIVTTKVCESTLYGIKCKDEQEYYLHVKQTIRVTGLFLLFKWNIRFLYRKTYIFMLIYLLIYVNAKGVYFLRTFWCLFKVRETPWPIKYLCYMRVRKKLPWVFLQTAKSRLKKGGSKIPKNFLRLQLYLYRKIYCITLGLAMT